MHLLLTRPAEDSAPLADKLSAHGIASTIQPLLNIRYVETSPPGLNGVQGLLVTSANGIRAFARVSPVRDIPVWAVGSGSAAEAQSLGFSEVRHADGDVAALSALVQEQADPDAGTLLHIAGTQRAGDLGGVLNARGFDYRRAVLYEAVPGTELGVAAQTALSSGQITGVTLYSPRTAQAFAKLIVSAELTAVCERLTVFCLSQAVADAVAGLPWRLVSVAETANEDSLISGVLQAVSTR